MTAEHPEGWTPSPDTDDVQDALEEIDAVASEHGGEYAAGMRHARLIVEEEMSR